LATSYISYLINVLEGEDTNINIGNFKRFVDNFKFNLQKFMEYLYTHSGFRAELVPSSRKINAERRALMKKEIQVSFYYHNDDYMFVVFSENSI